MGTGILITTDLTFLAEASENLNVAGCMKRGKFGGGGKWETEKRR